MAEASTILKSEPEVQISNRRYKRYLEEQESKNCFYCKRELNVKPLDDEVDRNPWLDPTKDHIIPKSKGGTGQKKNLRPCCYQCNKFKANQTPEEFLRNLEEKASQGRYMSYSKLVFQTMIESAKTLISEIEPIRGDLYREGWDPREPLNNRLKSVPMISQGHISGKTQKAWLEEFQKKHPYIYAKMMEVMPDMAVWIYHNIVKNKEI